MPTLCERQISGPPLYYMYDCSYGLHGFLKSSHPSYLGVKLRYEAALGSLSETKLYSRHSSHIVLQGFETQILQGPNEIISKLRGIFYSILSHKHVKFDSKI